MGGPIPDKLYDYDYNDDGLDHSVRSAEIFLEIGALNNYWIYSDVNDSEINQNIRRWTLFETTQNDLVYK